MRKNVIVIGGGPAGITAAIYAAGNGNNVTILEHMDKPGKKLLITGNGRCNLTNEVITESCYNSENSQFIFEALELFGYNETIEFLNSIGIYTKSKKGYIYPITEQATTVLNMMLSELIRLKVKLKYNQDVTQIIKTDNGYGVVTPSYTYMCDKVIVATGSKAAPVTGADGSGYDILSSLGHAIIPPLPALVSLKTSVSDFCKLAKGVRTDIKLSLLIDEEKNAQAQGELQLTEYGISGIVVFEISRHVVKALYNKKEVSVEIDLAPQYTIEELESILITVHNHNENKTTLQILSSILNENLAKAVLKYQNDEVDLSKLARSIKKLTLPIIGYNGFDKCQVCQGGVDTKEIDVNTMESKLHKGLYIVGEVVDVDGICGGYNLQWAFTSGAIAGKSI